MLAILIDWLLPVGAGTGRARDACDGRASSHRSRAVHDQAVAEAVKRLGIETVTVQHRLGRGHAYARGGDRRARGPQCGRHRTGRWHADGCGGAASRDACPARRAADDDRAAGVRGTRSAHRGAAGGDAAEAEEAAARQRLQRLEQLLKDGAASVRSVEEARAQHRSAWRRSRPRASASAGVAEVRSAPKASSRSLRRSMASCSRCPRRPARRLPRRRRSSRSRRSTRCGSGCRCYAGDVDADRRQRNRPSVQEARCVRTPRLERPASPRRCKATRGGVGRSRTTRSSGRSRRCGLASACSPSSR